MRHVVSFAIVCMVTSGSAFAADVTGRIPLEPVRAELDRLLASRLDGALAQENRS